MSARWINAEIATCAIAGSQRTGRTANRVYGKVTMVMFMIDFEFCRAAVAIQRVAHPNASMERQPYSY